MCDDEAFEIIDETLKSRGRHWNGTLRGVHVYAINENPGKPVTPFAIWFNHGGQYAKTQDHALNVKRFHWPSANLESHINPGKEGSHWYSICLIVL